MSASTGGTSNSLKAGRRVGRPARASRDITVDTVRSRGPADTEPERAVCDEFSFCVLGSGSGGNCSVLKIGDKTILIDAGFGPVTTAKRLKSLGIAVHELDGLFLTHLDRDHFRPNWIATLVQWQIPVYIHAWHAADLDRLPKADRLRRHDLVREFDHVDFDLDRGITVSTVRLLHDDKGTTGFHFETAAGRLGFATDLGHVPDELIERFTDVDLLAIESNYDPVLQTGSDRPIFLKRRIMGKAGHLSNEQAYEAIAKIASRSRDGLPQHVVLLHQSGQCNTPECIRNVFKRDSALARRITLTHQKTRTRWINVSSLPPMQAQQLTLGF